MTYKEIINIIEEASLKSPAVESFHYGDMDNLNIEPDIKYPRVLLIPTPHEFVSPVLNNFTFTLVYVDRLVENRYKRDIQSQAISTLKDILNRFKDWSEGEARFEDIPYTVNYTTINVYHDPQRFADALSGAYMNIAVQAVDDNRNCYYDE